MPDMQITLTEFSELVASYTADFVGREWLVGQVNALLDDPDCRIVVLTGGAGMGKSAFAAHLAATHPHWPRYFIRRDSRELLSPGDAKTFLLTVGGQLATLYPDLFKPDRLEIVVRQRIGELKAGGEAVAVRIKELQASPFYRVAIRAEQEVQRVAGKATGVEIGRLVAEPRQMSVQDLQCLGLLDPAQLLYQTNPEARIVVVVDALDELRYSPAEEDLLRALCEMPDMPSNLRFVVTSRREKFLDRLLGRSDARELLLAARGKENRQDLRNYAEANLPNGRLEPALARENRTRASLIENLLGKADGNFLYLRSVLRAIEQGLAVPAKMYQVHYLVGEDRLPDDLDALYDYFLASIVEWVKKSGFGDAAWRQYLRPMLGTLAVAREPLSEEQLGDYTGLHSEDLGDLLRELRQFVEPVDSQRLYRIYHTSFAEYLLDARTNVDYRIEGGSWHGRLANYYLHAWGGLEDSLPQLQEAKWRDLHSGYGLRHLAAHLEGAGQEEDLHMLLQLERKIDEHWENVWFGVKEATGDPGGYLADIQRARQMAAASDQMGRHMRYTLILSSLNSLARNIPLALIEALLSAQIWTLAEALSYARQKQDPCQRARALAALATELQEPQKTEVVKEILAASKLVKKGKDETLAWLSPRLAEQGLVDEALQLARSIDGHEPSVSALVALVPYLTEAKRTDAVKQAYQHTEQISEPFRAASLSEVVPLLSESLLRDLLASIEGMESDLFRGWALAILVSRLAEEGKIEQATKLTSNIADTFSQVEAKALLVPCLPEPQRSDVLGEVMASLRGLDDGAWRTSVGDAMAGYPSILSQGIQLALERQSWRADVLKTVVPYLSPPLLNDAWELVLNSPDPAFMAMATEALLAHLSGDEKGERAKAALEPMRKIKDAQWRARGLASLVTGVSEAHSAALASEIIELIRNIEPQYDLIDTLSEIVPHLPDTTVGDALGLVRRLDTRHSNYEENPKHTLLNALALYLPPSRLLEALAIAQEIDDREPRALSMAALASELTESMLREALAEAQETKNEYVRAKALAALAPYLPDPLLNEALDLARRIQDKTSRAEIALPGLARGFEEPERTALLREAIAVAASMDDGERVAWAFEALPELPDPLLEEMLVAAREVARRAEEKSDEASRLARILAAIVPRLPEPRKSSIIKQALSAIPDIEEEHWQGQILWLLASELSQELFLEALQIVEQMSSAYERAMTWGFLISDASTDLQAYLVSRVLDEMQRFEATEFRGIGEQQQAAIARILPYFADLDKSLDLCQRMSEQNWQRVALVDMAPQLAPAQLTVALTLARALVDGEDRAGALLALGKHAPDQAVKEVVFRESFEAALAAGSDHPHYRLMPPIVDEMVRALSPASLGQLWTTTSPALATLPRSELLANLVSMAPLLIEAGGTGTVRETFGAIHDTARWWP